MKAKDLAPNPKNPRTITTEKLNQLRKALLEFGDLSGIVFNRASGQLIGGHQRAKNFDEDAAVEYVRKYSRPTKTGTVAEGYVEFNGERYNYREVKWNKDREKAANLAANKSAGEWDLPQVGEWLKELGSFDVNYDLDLTMFDVKELKLFEPKPKAAKPPGKKGYTRLTHECPECGHSWTSADTPETPKAALVTKLRKRGVHAEKHPDGQG